MVDQVFTGGDGLTGLASLVHQVMMKNELKGGTGAYELGYAKAGRSGLSFGGNQMDLSKNLNAVEVLTDILFNARDGENNRFIAQGEVNNIVTKAQQPGKSPTAIFGDKLPAINAALSSDYGVEQINAVYITEINSRVERINNVIDNYITNPEAKPFFNTDFGKVVLVDYDNQFNLDLSGSQAKLMNYINGQHVSLNSGVYPNVYSTGSFDENSYLNFVLLTQYGSTPEGEKDVVRRYNNIGSIVEPTHPATYTPTYFNIATEDSSLGGSLFSFFNGGSSSSGLNIAKGANSEGEDAYLVSGFFESGNSLTDFIKFMGNSGLDTESESFFSDAGNSLNDKFSSLSSGGSYGTLASFLGEEAGDSQSLTWGDPHLVTPDNLKYDFQKPGEYVLLGSTTDDFQIQVRQELWGSSSTVAITSAVSTQLNGTTIGLYVNSPDRKVLYGTSGNDRLQATEETQLVLGDKDTGSIQYGAGGDMTFIASNAGLLNAFGYYVKDDEGNPVSGQIVWANAKTTAPGSTFSYNLNVSSAYLGFFLLADGYARNAGLVNGDAVTFGKVNGQSFGVFKGGQLLQQSGFTFTPPTYAYFSDTNLNADGIQHQKFIDNVQYWEDLHKSITDNSYSDVIFGTTINNIPAPVSGDTLTGSAGAETFGYLMGSDGVDSIRSFNVTQDNITFYQATESNISLQDVNGGTLITTIPANGGTAGAVWVEKASSAQVRPRINFSNSTTLERSNLYIGGEEILMQSGELKAVGNGLIYRDNNKYTVITESGDGFVATMYGDHIDVQPFLSSNRAPGTTYGLLGNYNGIPGDDIALKDGTVLGSPVLAEELYGEYADSWRVKENDTLFIYKSGTNTSSFDNSKFVKHYASIADYSNDAVAQAISTVNGIGYNASNPFFLDIVLDKLSGLNVTQGVGFNTEGYGQLYTLDVQTSHYPTGTPSFAPVTPVPTGQPSSRPSGMPNTAPSARPSAQPGAAPSGVPTGQPVSAPSVEPSAKSSEMPSALPSAQPSSYPSAVPSAQPIAMPIAQPSGQPSGIPSRGPTSIPTGQSSRGSTSKPSGRPSGQPSSQPSRQPSAAPSREPSGEPVGRPTSEPSAAPSSGTSFPPSAAPAEELMPTALPGPGIGASASPTSDSTLLNPAHDRGNATTIFLRQNMTPLLVAAGVVLVMLCLALFNRKKIQGMCRGKKAANDSNAGTKDKVAGQDPSIKVDDIEAVMPGESQRSNSSQSSSVDGSITEQGMNGSNHSMSAIRGSASNHVSDAEKDGKMVVHEQSIAV